jgi:hypothetical protein
MLVSAYMMMKKREGKERERERKKEKTRPSFVSVHKRDETRRTSLPDRTSYVWNNLLNEYIHGRRHISIIIFIYWHQHHINIIDNYYSIFHIMMRTGRFIKEKKKKN